ncbi:TPA: helix-turn-helix domain-containing protein [Clostridioides difficile]
MIDIDTNKRIKEIREDINLSQQKFGEKLGVSRDVISNIENNRVEVKTVFITHMCEVFSVNQVWLETGEGRKFIEQECDIVLGEVFANITVSKNENLKELIINISKLNDTYINNLNEIVKGLIQIVGGIIIV